MSVRHFVLKPDQQEPALNVVGTHVTVLASNAATQSHGITLQQGDEGPALRLTATIGTKRSTFRKGRSTSCVMETRTPAAPVRWFMFPEEPYTPSVTEMAAVRCSRSQGPVRWRLRCSRLSTRRFPLGRRMFQGYSMCSSAMG